MLKKKENYMTKCKLKEPNRNKTSIVDYNLSILCFII